MASATFGLTGWSRFSEEFRNGYLNGFLDMANLARNLEPGGWVDERYPSFPKVKPQEWRGAIDKLYQDPANKDYLITSMIQLAARTMKERYGAPTDPSQRARARMLAQLAAVKAKNERRAAAVAAKDPAEAPRGDKAGDKPAEAKANVAVQPAGKPAQLPLPPHRKKWCRCDGTDPEAARAKHREEAAAREAAEDAAPAVPEKSSAKAPAAAVKAVK